jgi:O-acetylhomoserine/O-acetylserine sulfhydrylase-like pyridoxal-dependent enzyme
VTAPNLIVTFKKYGIGVKFVTDDKPESFAAAIDDKTKAIYVESIGNPKYNVSPLPELAKVSGSRSPRPTFLNLIFNRLRTIMVFHSS